MIIVFLRERNDGDNFESSPAWIIIVNQSDLIFYFSLTNTIFCN